MAWQHEYFHPTVREIPRAPAVQEEDTFLGGLTLNAEALDYQDCFIKYAKSLARLALVEALGPSNVRYMEDYRRGGPEAPWAA